MDWSKYPNFTEEEFRCRHCGKAPMDEAFLAKLQLLRSRLGRPIQINSGYRCPEHNSQVSSTGRTGPHTTGKAVDIASHSDGAYSLVRLALELGFLGIGVSQRPGQGRFIHIDTLTGHESQRPAIWSY